jgi:Isocitrate dehydrogenase kinase/phosphatase
LRTALARSRGGGDEVILHHVYTERRLYPLDLYLREMGPDLARAAAIDYGNAIKDLASANIFPGDLFPKNFGVSRHGVVVFYDYDELALLFRGQVPQNAGQSVVRR